MVKTIEATCLWDVEKEDIQGQAEIDYAVFSSKIRRQEKLKDKKKRWNWIKRNSEIV